MGPLPLIHFICRKGELIAETQIAQTNGITRPSLGQDHTAHAIIIVHISQKAVLQGDAVRGRHCVREAGRRRWPARWHRNALVDQTGRAGSKDKRLLVVLVSREGQKEAIFLLTNGAAHKKIVVAFLFQRPTVREGVSRIEDSVTETEAKRTVKLVTFGLCDDLDSTPPRTPEFCRIGIVVYVYFLNRTLGDDRILYFHSVDNDARPARSGRSLIQQACQCRHVISI